MCAPSFLQANCSETVSYFPHLPLPSIHKNLVFYLWRRFFSSIFWMFRYAQLLWGTSNICFDCLCECGRSLSMPKSSLFQFIADSIRLNCYKFRIWWCTRFSEVCLFWLPISWWGRRHCYGVGSVQGNVKFDGFFRRIYGIVFQRCFSYLGN